jgi:ABC-type iron transport system FetAB ATPase subunit
MTGNAARVLKVAVAALAAVALVGVSNADATHVVKIASHISIKSRNLTFHGRVTSPNHACQYKRKVTLYRTNGDVLGHTTTNSRGHWKITASGSAGISLGHFYAKVKREAQGAAGTLYVCKAAKSKTIPVHSTASSTY